MYESKVKKEDRIKFNLEWIMSQQWIRFNRNITDQSFIHKAENQFLEFPNWNHDDVIDTISQAIEVFRKKATLWSWVKKKTRKVWNPDIGAFVEVIM
jgi:hypothetical protein